MQPSKLSEFLASIQQNNWITHSHICIYVAIVELWIQNDSTNPVSISRSRIMNMAKVSANGTYHKCIRDLVKGKYISYSPSYHPSFGSLIYVLILPQI